MTNSIEIDGLVQVAKWVSTLLLTGSVLCITVVFLRSLKKSEFKLGQLEIPLRLLPVALVALTTAHAYLTWLLSIKVDALVAIGGATPSDAWNVLVGKSDAIIFNGMKPRVHAGSWPLFGPVYATEVSDPTFWLNLAFAVAVIASVVVSRIPVKGAGTPPIWHINTLNSLMMGTLLALANWLLGSYWAIRLSELAK